MRKLNGDDKRHDNNSHDNTPPSLAGAEASALTMLSQSKCASVGIRWQPPARKSKRVHLVADHDFGRRQTVRLFLVAFAVAVCSSSLCRDVLLKFCHNVNDYLISDDTIWAWWLVPVFLSLSCFVVQLTKHSARTGKRRRHVVRFSRFGEVRSFHFDWSRAEDVFYTREDVKKMGQGRFDDVAALRKQKDKEIDGGRISRQPSVEEALCLAFEDSDRDEEISIRGIEHFVYPVLQQEMIRRKKQVQREVLEFARSGRINPQGWRLAEHSRRLSQWARNVATEKAVKYCGNNTECDLEKLSQDDLRQLNRVINGNPGCRDDKRTVGEPLSSEAGHVSNGGNLLELSENDDVGHEKKD